MANIRNVRIFDFNFLNLDFMPISYTIGPNMKTNRSLEQSVIRVDDYRINYYIVFPSISLLRH